MKMVFLMGLGILFKGEFNDDIKSLIKNITPGK
jgi:hypothetical protein